LSTTFPNIAPLSTTAGSSAAKIVKNEFGDGYTQRVADGLNTIRSSWSLEWTVSNANKNTIIAFLEARGGYDSFLLPTAIYTPLGETSTSLWTCDKWSSEYTEYVDSVTNIWNISLTITKEFDLI